MASQAITYDFTKSSVDNDAQIQILLNKMVQDTANKIGMSKSHKFGEKLASLFLPRAEASSKGYLTIYHFIKGLVQLSTGIVLGSIVFGMAVGKDINTGKAIIFAISASAGMMSLVYGGYIDMSEAFSN